MARDTNHTPSDPNELVRKIVSEYRREAEDAKRSRMRLNRRNWALYYGNVDWTHKTEGQSVEHLPKLGVAAEQMTSFIRRSLVQFGDFFSVKVPRNSPVTAEQVRALMRLYLEKLAIGRQGYDHIASIIADGVKQGLMESLIVLKVHGGLESYRRLASEPGDPLVGIPDKLTYEDEKLWRLRIDVIPTNDYSPDPTGRRLYEIHRVERDLADVWDMVDQGLYSKSAVEKLTESVEREDEMKKQERDRNQNETTLPSYRKRVVLDECWGTLLGPNGRPLEGQTNIVCTVANDNIVIREPEANPFWHQESPFVARPIIRSPDSVWSKAAYDDAAALNQALDEIFNLNLDGGIAAVWGVRQVRTAWLEDPRSVSNGIPQGATLAVSADAPPDAKVVESVTSGQVPTDGIAIESLIDREFNAAAMTNDPRMGFLSPRSVKATEIIAADQGINTITDSLAADLEMGVIAPALRKAWLLILQNIEDLSSDEVVNAIGVSAAFRLSRMPPIARYDTFARGCQFQVSGLSQTLAAAREFQSYMALQQGIALNPMLMESFVRRYSNDKALDHWMRVLNINPESFTLSEEEKQEVQQRVNRAASLAPMIGGAQGGSPPRQPGDGGGMDRARSDMSQTVQQAGGYQ